MKGTNRGGLALPMHLQDRICEFVSCHVWVSRCELSTTGWGDSCTYHLLRCAAAANRHAREALKARIKDLRSISAPQPKFLQPEDEPGRFKRLSATSLLVAGFPAVRNFVAAVSNYHGDHMDGCGNPYMAEWWWVEKRAINSPHELDAMRPGKRRQPDVAGGCVTC